MDIDLELYRREIPVSKLPLLNLSLIDIAPESPQNTIIFIHGFGGRALHWRYQLKEFSIKNRVIAFDLRGHGHSDKPPGKYTMAEIVSDLEIAIDQLKISEKFVLVGHSLGGAIVTEYAVRNQHKIDRMILIASSGEFKLDPIRRIGLNIPLPILRLVERFTQRWLFAPFFVMKPFYHNTLATWNGWSLFRDITIPSLVIRGHRDRLFATHLFEEVARLLPNAEEENLGASGHMVMLERRDATNRAIKRFLEKQIRSWRETSSLEMETTRAELVQERPWLKHYEDGVPYTIAIPDIPVHQFLLSATRRFPFHNAIIFEGRRITYRHLYQDAIKFANFLITLGVKKGDRVMLLLPNIPQMAICFFGALIAGAIPVYTLPDTNTQELIRKIQDSGTKILVCITQFAENVHQANRKIGSHVNGPLEQIIFTNVFDYLPLTKKYALQVKTKKSAEYQYPFSSEEGVHDLRQSIQKQSQEYPKVKISSDDLAVLVYTGGTTADSKGVILSHRNLVANTLQTRHWIPDAKERQERFLCVIPFSHIYGLTTALITPVALGATLILKAKFEAREILETIKRYRPTIFPGVPQMYLTLGNYPGVRRFKINSINACLSGSAPLAIETQEKFEKLTRGRLVEGYGLTEASPVTHANPLNGLRKVGSIGIPLPSTEAKIIDLAKGRKTIPPGQIGELAVRGPQVMREYWNNQNDTEKVITKDGWLLTGDVAQVDPDGYFRIIARKVDMWYPSKPDQPAFPRDVEEVLYDIPQIKEAAVVAIAGQPIAFLIAEKEQLATSDLIAYCKRRLPPELVPRFVVYVDDFPRTFIGKVIRRELAKRYEEKA